MPAGLSLFSSNMGHFLFWIGVGPVSFYAVTALCEFINC